MTNWKKYNKSIEDYKRLRETSGALHPVVKEQIKQRLMAVIRQDAPEVSRNIVVTASKSYSIFRYVSAAITILVMAGAGTVYASQKALPGNFLYPIKLASENAQVGLAVSTEAKANLETEFAARRADELAKVSGSSGDKAGVESGADNNGSGQGAGNGTADADVTVKAEARHNMSQALSRLRDVQAKLETKGNGQAAAAVQDAINRLETRVGDDHSGSSSGSGEGSQEGDSDSHRGSSGDRGGDSHSGAGDSLQLRLDK